MAYYRPQRSCGKVMFLHLSVILFRGGCLPQYMLGYTPQADTPWADTTPDRHPPLGRHIPLGRPLPAETAADGTHPTGMHSCSQSFNGTGTGRIASDYALWKFSYYNLRCTCTGTGTSTNGLPNHFYTSIHCNWFRYSYSCYFSVKTLMENCSQSR